MRILLGTLFVLGGASAGVAGPIPVPESAIDSVVGKYLLERAAANPETLSRFAQALRLRHLTPEELPVRLRAGGNAALRAEVEERIASIQRRLAEARRARNGGRDVPEAMELSPEEKIVLEITARSELRFREDLDWGSGDPEPGRMRFFREPEAGEPTDLRGTRERWLAPRPAETDSPLLAEPRPIEEAPPEAQARAKRSLREWYRDSQSCIQSRPKDAARKRRLGFILEQMGIGAAVTVTSSYVKVRIDPESYRVSLGFAEIKPANLSVDLLMSLVSTGVMMALLKDQDPIQVRWAKVTLWGINRADLDATVYFINPRTGSYGEDKLYDAEDRRVFNYFWNTETSWVNPAVFTIFAGMECLAEKEGGLKALKAMKPWTLAARVGIQEISSIIYYNKRENELHPRQKAP